MSEVFEQTLAPDLVELLAALGAGQLDPKALYGFDTRVLDRIAERAVLLFRSGKAAEGDALLTRLANLEPTAAGTTMQLAALRAEVKDYARALEAYRSARTRTDDPATLQTIAFSAATVCLELSDYAAAAVELAAAAAGPDAQTAELASALLTKLPAPAPRGDF